MKKRLSCMLKADAFGLDGSLLLPSLVKVHVHLSPPTVPRISGIRDRIHRLLLLHHAQTFLCSCHLAVLRQRVQQVFLALTGDTAWLSVGNPNDDSGFGLYNLELCRTSRINIDLQKPLNFISNV